MNKRGMLARDYVIVLIIFGMVIGLGFLFVADMASSESGYNVSGMIDESFQGKYDTLTDTSQDVYAMQNATASGEGLSTISTFTVVFKATFSIISIIFGSFGLVNSVFSNFALDFGVPSIVANIFFPGILVIAIAIIIFVIVSSVSQGKL